MARPAPIIAVFTACFFGYASNASAQSTNAPTRNVVEMEYGSKVDPAIAAQQIADTAGNCWVAREAPFQGFKVAGREQMQQGNGYWINFADQAKASVQPKRTLRIFVVQDRGAFIAGVEQSGVPDAEPFLRRELSGLAKGKRVACR
jgi:hypothetical protein